MECNINKLKNLDYSHLWVTAPIHIIEIYESSRQFSGGKALELGSFKGHSTLALSLAGLEVTSYDIDDSCEEERKNLLVDFNVIWIKDYSKNSIKIEKNKFDVIFHDADHGDHVSGEVVDMYHQLLKSGGIMFVHDTDVFNLGSLCDRLGNCRNTTTLDHRGRQLTTFYKP